MLTAQLWLPLFMAWSAMYEQTSHCTRVGLHDRESSIANARRQLLVLVNPDTVSEAHAGEALRDTIARMGTFEHAAMTLPAYHPLRFRMEAWCADAPQQLHTGC